MNPITEFFIRVSSFVRKEMAEIVRQPRLVATLILGPFLILFLFGIGYNNTFRTMRAVMVIPPDSQIEEEIKSIAERLGGAVDLVDFVSSETEGTRMLGDGAVDLVLVTPADPYGDISANRHAQMEIIHHEIDPIEQMFVTTLERAYVEEVNRLIMIRALDSAQKESDSTLEQVQQAQENADELHQDLEAGDISQATEDAAALAEDFQRLNLALKSNLASFAGISSTADQEQVASPLESLARAEALMLELKDLNPDKADYSVEIGQVQQLQEELAFLAEFLTRFINVDAAVLARPFEGQAVQFSTVTFGPIDFYVPGVISLLLQHIAITLAALSIVRERVGGAIELFRAAPVTAFETLLGKTTSFMILGAVLAVVLTALVILALQVPMLGSWLFYILVIVALLYTSLGMGFAISSISQTDSQAVQYSMIVLLASIFFSGFFIALYRLLDGVRIVSWLLPATYGTAMLQDIMLRGQPPPLLLFAGLIVFGFLLYTFAWWRLRRVMSRE